MGNNNNKTLDETIVIFIDSDNDIEKFTKDFGKSLKEYKTFTNIKDAIEYIIKEVNFKDIKIFISDKLYDRFILAFQDEKNIKQIRAIPNFYKITENKTKQKKSENNDFYDVNEITYKEIKYCLKKEITPVKWLELDDSKFTFEYIESKKQLILPVYYKYLIELIPAKSQKEYIKSLFDNYSKNNKEFNNLLKNILYMEKIPNEILSKYYARLYSFNSKFYLDINSDLRNDHIEQHLPFIQTLYEGVKLKSLPLASENILYRGSIIPRYEIEKIRSNERRRISDIPDTLAFSKSFLSFTKDINVALNFVYQNEKKENFFKVLFVLQKDNIIDSKTSTHCDLENISFYPEEKEVLFFPFSAFEIKDINEMMFGKEEGYLINLLYISKFLKDFEENKSNINETPLPESEFATQALQLNKSMPNLTLNKLEDQFKNGNPFKSQDKSQDESICENNIIKAQIRISHDDINNNIQIINSFENVEKNKIEGTKKQTKYENKNDIKDNVEIRINNENISFVYEYKFSKEGNYNIEYIFKKKLTKINHMFYNCNKFITLDFSNFNTEEVINMSYMFCGCDFLTSLDLSNFDTKNVQYMKHMFDRCHNLNTLNLSKFDTSKVIDMHALFKECKSLKSLNLENFRTKYVTNMKYMFKDCESLSNLNISNFDTKMVSDMCSMFDGCSNLAYFISSNFSFESVIKMNYMFQNCKSLQGIKLISPKNAHLIESRGVFKDCQKLELIDLSEFDTTKIKDMSFMFQNCKELKHLDLSKFKFQNVTNKESMFSGCYKLDLSNINMNLGINH